MANFKTPGVYVQEISIFPPSVAQVETAIPAFIGYTRKAEKSNGESLLNKPTKISSALDFVTLFGGAPDVDVSAINLNNLNQVTAVELNERYYMYESIRMFFANGGGDCYIVSVGQYGSSIQNGDASDPVSSPGFLVGLDALKKQDDPTLLLAPDAVLMSQSDINSLYQAMLAQCKKLQDRFSIFDLKENVAEYETAVDDFRAGIGMDALKYGAAYTPWVKANLPRTIAYKDFHDKIFLSGAQISLAALLPAAEANAIDLANRLDGLVEDNEAIHNELTGMLGGSANWLSKFEQLSSALKSSNSRDDLRDLLEFYVNSMDYIRNVINLGTAPVSGDIDLNDNTVPGNLMNALQTALNTSLDDTRNVLARIYGQSSNLSSAIPTAGLSSTSLDLTTTTSASIYFTTGATNATKIAPHVSEILGLHTSIISAINFILNTAKSTLQTVETSAKENIPVLKTIMDAIAKEYITLPPSGAIAGVYARVDADRGVWKAPANVSLNNVVSLATIIDSDMQESLNINVDAGKSINAIRSFTGKGTMVWGARTLAGNDNEWRYVPVRRFFNMVEESVKKATETFVFEPNDANTWVKVRTMIENFLTLQWRAGALAGAKPDEAFFVRVGLGQTMTAEDILNGYMHVEIGMAVVRPAEFIVLKFSHKLQES